MNMSLSRSLAVTAIPVTDLDLAKPFYRDVLGLELIEDTPCALRFSAGDAWQSRCTSGRQVERGRAVAHFKVSESKRGRRFRSRHAVSRIRGGSVRHDRRHRPVGTTRAAWLEDPEGDGLGLR